MTRGRGSTSTPLKEWFTAFSFRETISLRTTNGAGSEQRLAQFAKYRLAIEPIAACYACDLQARAVVATYSVMVIDLAPVD